MTCLKNVFSITTIIVALGALLPLGCSIIVDNTLSEKDGAGVDSGLTDAGMDTSLADAGPDACGTDDASCCPGEAECGGACIDVSQDVHNCGACGVQVPPGSACIDGVAVTPPPADELDLLFLVDNSNSMHEEQASLAMAEPELFAQLGMRYRSINVGVITTDMGAGGNDVPTCEDSYFGDDGVLQTTVLAGGSGCPSSFDSPFLTFTRDGAQTPAEFVRDVICISRLGTGGCGFEQPLEAILKALSPSTPEPTEDFDGRFFRGTPGHADDANTGFLRPDADLAIVILTDEEDCSVNNPDLFDPRSEEFREDLNLRCFRHPEVMYPIERYTSGLLAARGSERLHVLVIAGVPTDATGDDFEAILSHPDMRERIDSSMTARLTPSCNVAGRGLAYAPRRIVELGRQLHAERAQVSIQSICQADFSPAMDALVRLLM